MKEKHDVGFIVFYSLLYNLILWGVLLPMVCGGMIFIAGGRGLALFDSVQGVFSLPFYAVLIMYMSYAPGIILSFSIGVIAGVAASLLKAWKFFAAIAVLMAYPFYVAVMFGAGVRVEGSRSFDFLNAMLFLAITGLSYGVYRHFLKRKTFVF